MSPEDSRITLGVEDIDRKYAILAKIAEGGMGAIYRARHELLDEVRAIKTVRAQYRDDPELRERFLREARVATQLHHPNIARIHDLSVGEDGTACIVMELVQGITLVERLRQQPPLSQEEILELACQTLDALGYLHQRRVVHRDISPDNIMLSRLPDGNPQVKLIDLGIAKPLEGGGFQTRTAMFIGKVRYASPEQLGGGGEAGSTEGSAIDGRSDLYSLGVVLYELLTGTLPVRGADEASVIAGHLFHPPRDFAETDPEGRLSPALRQVLLRALQKEPRHRFQTAADFVQALRGSVGGTGAAAMASEAATRLQVLPGSQDATVLASPATSAATVLAGSATATAPTLVPGVDPAATEANATAVPAAAPRRRLSWLAGGLALLLTLGLGGTWIALRDGAATQGAGGAAIDPAAWAGLNFGRYKALVIGNDDYRYLARLETATRDAREVADVLQKRYGFEVQLELNVDRQRMLDAISTFAASAEPDDNLLVYYAGHGALFGRDQQASWQPIDAQPMEDTQWVHTSYEVATQLAYSNARHVLVVTDSCFAAALTRGAMELEQLALNRAAIEQSLGERSRLVLASGGQKPVADSAGDGHSVFSGALLDTLRDNQDLLPVQEVLTRLAPRVARVSDTLDVPQRPQLGIMEGSLAPGDAFYFLPRDADASSAL